MNIYDHEYLKAAHYSSSNNKEIITQGKLCGCFCCEKTFKSSEIEKWIDKNRTALCPKCGIDSVIGEHSGLPINDLQFLKSMSEYWFSDEE